MSLRVPTFPVIGLDSSVHSGLMFSSTHTLIFLPIHDTLISCIQHHISNASLFLPLSISHHLGLFSTDSTQCFFFFPGLSHHLGSPVIADDCIHPCRPVCRVVLFQTHLCHVSCMHLSIVGLAVLFFFSPVSPHLTFFSLCAPLSFSSHGRTTSVVFL